VRGVRTAVTFLTTLPIPALAEVRPDDLRRSVPHFPFVGMLVGGVVAAVLWAPVTIPAGVRAAVALLIWQLVTGMLHLDGLLDSSDALLAPVSVDRRLEILRDVRVGAFGIGIGVTTLLLLWSVLASGPPWWSPIVAAAVARFAAAGPLSVFPAARPSGMGAAARGGQWWWGAAYVAPLLVLPRAWIALLAALGIAWLGAWWAARRLGGGLTGDVIGALVLIGEVAALGVYVVG